jgi:NADH:ubiquinone oxidoreductase subunit E
VSVTIDDFSSHYKEIRKMKHTGLVLEHAEEYLEKIYRKYCHEKGSIIPILQEFENEFGYIPEEAIRWIAERLEIPESRFFGVATFYAQFHLKPRGKRIITACSGTACHVKGSERLINGIRRELNLEEGEDTTEDMEFTFEKVNCVGACSIAPVVIIDKKVYGKATTDKIIKEIKSLKTGQ